MQTENLKDPESYRVQLQAFEGPLDLLLHLIRKQDLDIYDIPIATLLQQYIDYLSLAQELNIDLAGEFLEMAAELTYIKSKMLLPEPPEGEGEEESDPRADLLAKLLEYQRYKMAAQTLLAKPLLGKETFRRPPEENEENFFETELNVEADLMLLLSAFQDLLKKIPQEHIHEMSSMRMGIAERILELMERLKGESQIAFEDLFVKETTRSDLVTTFLATLEMAKQNLIRVIQEKVLGKIYVVSLLTRENGERGSIYES